MTYMLTCALISLGWYVCLPGTNSCMYTSASPFQEHPIYTHARTAVCIVLAPSRNPLSILMYLRVHLQSALWSDICIVRGTTEGSTCNKSTYGQVITQSWNLQIWARIGPDLGQLSPLFSWMVVGCRLPWAYGLLLIKQAPWLCNGNRQLRIRANGYGLGGLLMHSSAAWVTDCCLNPGLYLPFINERSSPLTP